MTNGATTPGTCREVGVPMRDGVVLHADLYLPAGDDPHPVLVHRTAYGTLTAELVVHLVADPAHLAAQGYAVLVQDVRGRFASGGQWQPFVHEADDGYDTVEWAAAQPWSNGRVGVYGSSYMGITTYQAVAAAPPHLQAAAVWMAGSRFNDGMLRTGGAFELGFLSSWNLGNAMDTIDREGVDVEGRRALVATDAWDVVRALPYLDHPAFIVTPEVRRQVTHEPGDPLWQRLDLRPEQVTVPLLQVVGLRDWMAPSMVSLFLALQSQAGPHRMVAGPWTHHSAYAGPTGQRDLTALAPGGPVAHTPILLQFFGRHLRDLAPPEHDPVVRYFSTGDDAWRNSSRWPPADTTRSYYLGPGALLDAPGPSGAQNYVHDPLDPVPTVGGSCCHPALGPSGIVDHRAVAGRADVLVYTSAPLADPLRLVGDVTLTGHLVCSVEDTDVVAVLVDVHPDGYAEPVTEGVQRARYRLGGTQDWLVPGEVTELVVHLADTAHTVRAGHRLQLEVAGSSFPRFSRNLGTRVLPELAGPDDVVVSHHQLRHGVAHPSRLVLRTLSR